MTSSAHTSAGLAPDFGGGARLDRPRTLALGHVKTPLQGVGATARRTTQTPRRPNGAGGAREASQLRLGVLIPSMLRLQEKSSAKWRRYDRLLKSWPELQIRITQLPREGSLPPGLRLPQAKLSRDPNQVARGRIRRFESLM